MTFTALPVGARVQVRCVGSRKVCAFKASKFGKPVRGKLNVLKLFGKKRTFRTGAVVQVLATASGQIGQVVSFQIRTGKLPRVRNLCLAVGAKKPTATCRG